MSYQQTQYVDAAGLGRTELSHSNQARTGHLYPAISLDGNAIAHIGDTIVYRAGEVRRDQAWEAKEIEILKRLDKTPYRDRKDRNPDRIQGTCEWFVAHKHFRDWQESSTSSMLWVSADPGCGKSVLAKYLVDSVLPTTESRTTCYFFFKDDFEDQRGVVSALCCLLRQLFIQKRILLSEKVLEQFEVEGERFTSSFSELWDILLGVAEDKNAGEIFCLLDAIDECEGHGRSQLAEALCKLYGTRRNFNLKFLLTSRPYGGIRRGFQPLEIPGLPVIRLSGESDIEMEKISREINVFIKARVHNIGAKLKLRSDEQALLLRRIMDVPNRTYLWAHLTLDLIETDIDIDKIGIINATSHIPQTVYEAYNTILSKSRDTEKAKRLLHIVVAAARPLTLREMDLALAIRDNHQSYKDLDLRSEDRLRESVRDICGLFVTVIDSRIYLLHQTAKEFLVQNNKKIHPQSVHGDLRWQHSLRPQDSHRVLTEICMRHLLFAEFETHPLEEDAILSQYVGNHVFLDYSAKHWTAHLHESHMEVDNVMTQNMLRLCDASSKRCMTWFRIYWTSTGTDFPGNFTVLMIASYFGLTGVLMHLLEINSINLNSKDGTYGRSALSWAAGNGFDVAVELLIKGVSNRFMGMKLPFKKGAQVDSADRYGRTPLVYAVWNRHVVAVKLLLKAGARIDLMDEIGGTALSYAVCNGHNEVLKLLLKKGTKVDSEDSISMNLLLSAAKWGHEAVVKLLVEKGADLESKDALYGQTPLSWAAEKGHEAVVKLLLEKGADLESKSNFGWTPLSWAAKKGHEAVVKLLLEKGADLESKDTQFGKTPLLWAAEDGHVAVVKLLLEKGADLGSKDKQYDKEQILVAARYGYEAVVKLLLEKGADLESMSNSGPTPLSWAAEKGHEAIVKLLLETGRVNPDLKGENGRTPLSWAAERGHEAVVKLLLETGKANPDLKGENGRTPLSWAAEKGHEATVKLLLEKGADLESKSEYGQTPLSWAAGKGHEAVAKLLLENGADLESKSKYGQTPLSWAAGTGHEAMAKLLLEKGADLESKSNFGRTPLWWAVENGHEEVVKLLRSWAREGAPGLC